MMAAIVKAIVIDLCREMEQLRLEENRESLLLTLSPPAFMEVKSSVHVAGPVDWLGGTVCAVPYVVIDRQEKPYRIWKLVR